MKYLIVILTSTLILTSLHAQNIEKLATEFKLYAGTKATVQWKRIFSSDRRMQKYKLNILPQETKNRLKIYLINHAADSEQPIVPGL